MSVSVDKSRIGDYTVNNRILDWLSVISEGQSFTHDVHEIK